MLLFKNTPFTSAQLPEARQIWSDCNKPIMGMLIIQHNESTNGMYMLPTCTPHPDRLVDALFLCIPPLWNQHRPAHVFRGQRGDNGAFPYPTFVITKAGRISSLPSHCTQHTPNTLWTPTDYHYQFHSHPISICRDPRQSARRVSPNKPKTYAPL